MKIKLEWASVDKIKHCSWQAGMEYAASLGDDWRLPTRLELFTKMDAGKIKSVPEGHYWSSSPYANGTGFAWVVHLWYGFVIFVSKTFNYYAWPVRERQ